MSATEFSQAVTALFALLKDMTDEEREELKAQDEFRPGTRARQLLEMWETCEEYEARA